MANPTQNLRIGDLMVNFGYITQEQLNHALSLQKQDRTRRIAEILIDLGYITEEQKLDALARRLNLRRVDLSRLKPDASIAMKLPEEQAVRYNMLPIAVENGALLVATDDPLNFFAVEDVRQLTKMPLELLLAPSGPLHTAIASMYADIRARRAAQTARQDLSTTPEIIITTTADSNDAPVVNLLNSLLVRGYNSGVSDIHIEPFERFINVRMRVDGMLIDYMTLETVLLQPLIARIKILSSLNIAEKRIPQDGHFRIRHEGLDMNLRVSLLPTVYGEKAVLRYLNTNTTIDRSGSFGMTPDNYQKIQHMLGFPHGIVYLTGPTGSGKTTTLYMLLEHLAQRQVNIATVEDPVERNLPRVNQTQVHNQAGMTFESGLRSILRQDPDIIMVGETRDAETAQISVRAAITGHLVLSTLHTNDALSTVVRLEEMGVARHLIASSLVGVVAQRLMRKVCPKCGAEYDADPTELHSLGLTGPQRLRRGRGCASCNGTGYSGRIAIHEMAVIDRDMREMITEGASPDQLMNFAKEHQGALTLADSARELVIQGVTSVDEYLKVTYYV